MSRNWSRRLALALLSATTVLLAACGASTIESQFLPTRVVAFGDAQADLGENGLRYTVNDLTVNIWTEEVAVLYGRTLGRRVDGGQSYALAHARVNTKPDDIGNSATLTVKEQIDAFLSGTGLAEGDLVLLSGGTSDIIAEMAKVTAGTQTGDAALVNVRQAGRDLGAQVRRLVESGAKHVVVMGTYNLGRSPWATAVAQASLIETLSGKFNEELLVSIVDLGASVLYVDAALQVNLMTGTPTAYGFSDASSLACTSVDAGVGIGVGTNRVNSSLCTPATVAAVDYSVYIWADSVYLSPTAARRLGDYAFTKIRSRW